MSIRRARYGDLEAINAVLASAFFDEDVCGRVMHPRRREYPHDVIKAWRCKTRLDYWDWSNTFMVATDDKGAVVAVAEWARKGAVKARLSLAWWDPRNAMRLVARCQNFVSSWLWPNRAADPAKLDILERAAPWFAHHWQGPRADGYYLDMLGVAPGQQGHGYGKELVQWGLQQARNERVPASVMSSDGSDPFYLKCGFENIVGNATEGEGNPLNGVKGGSILFMDVPSEN